MLFILASAGLTWILVKSTAFKPLREAISRKQKMKPNFILRFFDGLLDCEACTGFWSGIAMYVLQYYKIEIALYAFAGSFCSLFLISMLKIFKSR